MKKITFLLLCFSLVSCFTEPKKETVTEVEIHRPGQYEALENIDTLTTNLTESEKTIIKNSIVLFDNVNGIYPGKSTLNDAIYILGTPDYIDIVGVEAIDGVSYRGNKIAKYNKIGIILVFSSLNENVGTIDAINVTNGFDGLSKEGIYIGIEKEKCLQILNEKYYFSRESDDNYFFTIDESKSSESQFIFKNNKLETIRTE